MENMKPTYDRSQHERNNLRQLDPQGEGLDSGRYTSRLTKCLRRVLGLPVLVVDFGKHIEIETKCPMVNYRSVHEMTATHSSSPILQVLPRPAP